MAQHDFVIDNAPGLAVRLDLQAALQALASLSSGPIEPVTMYANMLWFDTGVTPNVMRQRNAANTAWVAPATGALTDAPSDGNRYVRKDGAWVGNQIIRHTYAGPQTTAWTKPAGLKALEAELYGPGGAGGGAGGTAANAGSAGAGGGAGGYTRKLFQAADLPASVTVTVPDGGIGQGGANPGLGGGTASFGALLTATSGAGGNNVAGTTTVGVNVQGPLGGFGSGGDINNYGASGGNGTIIPFAPATSLGGRGADSPVGAGGREIPGNANGELGRGYASGGGGAMAGQNNGTPRVGGAGAPALLILTEYY